MPLYVYRCNKCRERFEALRGITDSDDDIACPRCGEKKPERVISSVCCGSRDLNKGNLRIPT